MKKGDSSMKNTKRARPSHPGTVQPMVLTPQNLPKASCKHNPQESFQLKAVE
jgi:hypothetical protein